MARSVLLIARIQFITVTIHLHLHLRIQLVCWPITTRSLTKKNYRISPDSGQDTIERSEIRQISNSVPVNTVIPEEKCAQHMVHFIDAQDQSDSGSLTTQAPQSNSIRATINALSTWISAVQPRESWYLAGWIRDSPIDFLVDPSARYRYNATTNW